MFAQMRVRATHTMRLHILHILYIFNNSTPDRESSHNNTSTNSQQRPSRDRSTPEKGAALSRCTRASR